MVIPACRARAMSTISETANKLVVAMRPDNYAYLLNESLQLCQTSLQDLDISLKSHLSSRFYLIRAIPYPFGGGLCRVERGLVMERVPQYRCVP